MAPLQAKVLLLGDSGVGKTCLRQRYLSNTFSNQFKASIGADFVFKKIKALEGTPDEVDINMQILDSAGQERFRSLAQAFYRGADACILCFSVAAPESLAHLQSWFKDFVERVDMDSELEDICFVAVATKSDLPSALPVDKMLQQLDELLPGSRLSANADQQGSGSSTPQESQAQAQSKPEPQPVQNKSRGQTASQSASLPSRTRKISSTPSNFSNSIYHTPAGSISTLTPGSYQSSSVSTIRARSDSDEETEDGADSVAIQGNTEERSPVPEDQNGEADQASLKDDEHQRTPTSEESGISRAFTLFYTSAKTGQSVADPFKYVAEQLALRLKERRQDQEWSRVDDDELEQVGMAFTLRNVTSRNHIMLDHHDDPILPLKAKAAEDSKTGFKCC